MVDKLDVAYIVSHGFAARMITQTDLAGKLVKEGLKVGIISPDINDQSLKDYALKEKIVLIEFNPKGNRWSQRYKDIRRYVLEDIRANHALLEKHIYALTNANKLRSKIKFYSLYLLYRLTRFFPFIKKWYLKREKQFLSNSQAKKLLRRYEPKVLISTYPVDFREGMLLHEARSNLNIKSVIHLLSWDNISCKGHFPALADKYISWGPIMKEEFVEYYNISETNIFSCGVPHFDLHSESRLNPKPERYLKELGLSPNHPYLFFAMSAPRFSPYEIEVVEELAKQIDLGLFGKEIQLVIRPHPQNVQGSMADFDWLPRLEVLKSSKVAIDYPSLSKGDLQWSMKPEDMIRLSNLIAGSSISLNSCSTVSIDSLMCGVPVVVTMFDGNQNLPYWQSIKRLHNYSHLKKLFASGGVDVAESFEQCFEMIKLYLLDPDRKLKIRNQTIQRQCEVIDGTATKNVLKQVKQLVFNDVLTK